MTTHQNPINVFLSYAHEDEPLLQQLKTHLSLLKRQGLISTWYDRQLIPGTNWTREVDQRLEQTSIILLLVSAYFLDSDYCYEVEMRRSLERHDAGEARVIPILVRPCDWGQTPFAKLQYLPHEGRAITEWRNRDRAWNDVVIGIRKTIEDLHSGNDSCPQDQILENHNFSSLVSNEKVEETDHQIPLQDTRNAISTGTAAECGPLVSSAKKAGIQHKQEHDQPIGALYYTLDDHTGKVCSLTWSSDGRYLASAGADKTIFITERATLHTFQLPREHTKTISTLSWSPNGKLLCSGSQDGFAHIWDIVTRKKLLTYDKHRTPNTLRTTLLGQGEIYSVAWSPNGRFIASGGGEGDCTAHVWDALSGERYYQYRGHAVGQDDKRFHAASAISSMAWSLDGSRLATASCLFNDLLEDDLSFKILGAIPGISHFIAWSQYAKIHVWNALTGDQVRIYPGHKVGVTALAWSPDGNTIASAGNDKTVQIWNPTTLCSPTHSFQSAVFSDHTDKVKAVAWSPDSIYLASAGNDATVQVWNVSTGERLYTYRSHVNRVRALAWSPSGDVIASAGDDGAIHLWNAPKLAMW